MWREIKKVIHQHQNFLLTTHLNPDGDGVGAATALTELLILMGKRVRFVCDSKIPSKLSFLDYHGTHEIYDTSHDYSRVEVIIVLDTHKKERIGHIADLFTNPSVIKICIDHHPALETFADYSAIDKEACSAGAMIYGLYKECGYELGFQAATGIYTSIICDTGRFSYSSTDRKAHIIADECMKYGVDPDVMHSRLFQHVSIPQTRLLVNALQGMETYLNNKVIIQSLSLSDSEKIGIDPLEIENADLDYIHDFNKLIEDVECTVLLRELPNSHVRVSVRSAPSLNICKIMEGLGGGGHRNAAGVSIKGSLEDVKKQIIGLIENLLVGQSCHTK
jgi:phosphoesterase RecJ-like protein